MLSFIVKRLLWMVVTLWVVFTVSFFLMRAVPGGPFDGDRQRRSGNRREHASGGIISMSRSIKQYCARTLQRTFAAILGYQFKLRDYTVNGVMARAAHLGGAGILALAFALSLGLSRASCRLATAGRSPIWMLMSLATIGIALPNFVVAGLRSCCSCS